MKKENPRPCKRCGRSLTTVEERMDFGDESTICFPCYEEMLFPGLPATRMEALDETKTSARPPGT